MKQTSLFPVLYGAILNATNTQFQSIFSLPFISNPSTSTSTSTPSSSPLSSDLPRPVMGYTSLSAIPQAQWLSLNASVSGRLYNDGTPFARACYTNYDGDESGGQAADSQACQSIQAGYLNEQYRLPHFGSLMSVCLSFISSFFPTSPPPLVYQAKMHTWHHSHYLDTMGNLSSYGRRMSPWLVQPREPNSLFFRTHLSSRQCRQILCMYARAKHTLQSFNPSILQSFNPFIWHPTSTPFLIANLFPVYRLTWERLRMSPRPLTSQGIQAPDWSFAILVMII